MAGNVQYRKLDKTLDQTTWEEIFAAADRLTKYLAAVGLEFVERGEVLGVIKYALSVREHVLMFGPTGAAKSKLIDRVYSGIVGAKVWGMDLTRFTNEAQLFGSYDVQEMRETGRLIHMTEGSLAEANFAKTGEFFDASDATLRTLLGALNERRIARGPQIIELPLITVVADTNFAPDTLGARQNVLQAVVDRFLFQANIRYIQDPASLLQMIKLELEDGVPVLPPLTLEDIVLVSGAVRGMNLLEDPYVVNAYSEMIELYKAALKKAGRPELSDRRIGRSLHIMEAHAIFFGREEVTFEDLESTQLVLAQSDQDRTLLEEARKAALAKWAQKSASREIDQEMAGLTAITQEIPAVDIANLTLVSLDQLVVQLEQVRVKLAGFKPDAIEVGTQHVQATKRLNEYLAQVEFRMIDLLVENLPTDVDKAGKEDLPALKEQAQRVRNRLQGMQPRSDAAIVKHAAAMEKAIRAISDIQTEFASLGMGEGG